MGPRPKIIWLILDKLLNIPMRLYPMHVYREIGSEVAFEKSWNEIAPADPLRVCRHFQAVSLQMDGAYHKRDQEGFQEGFFLGDGSYVLPDIEVEDDNHVWHRLDWVSYCMSGADLDKDISYLSSAKFSLREQAKAPFHRVRLRSDAPFICKKISWVNYNLK